MFKVNLSCPNTLKQTLVVPKRCATTATAKQKTSPKVVLPKAIKRSPTDILKALSSTVQKDFTAPYYKYIDDPFLTPASNFDKRIYSLSKESGRKAAQYFIDNYPQFFYRDISEPKIEAFTYKELYDESMELDELDLQKTISRCDVPNAITCYNVLVGKNTEMSEKTMEDFFDMICFYNCEPVPEHYADEEWFKKTWKFSTQGSTWKDNGFAEQLFENFPVKTNRVYSSLIQGMVKYRQFERAFSFYNQAIESNLKLNTETYNAMIESSFHLKENNDDRWLLITDILKTMQNNNIKPNLRTLNNILEQISFYKFWSRNYDFARKVLNEFAFKFGIRPSLATYYHLLGIFHKSKNSKNNTIYEIFDKLQESDFILQDPNDVNFLAAAMEVSFNLNDIQLSHRINKLAEANVKFIGPNSNHNNYYNKYLKLLCSAETIENFMDIYSRYIPHSYTPSIDLVEQILKTIKVYNALKYVPQIFTDLCLFSYMNRMELIESLLSIMNEVKSEDPLLSQFSDIVLQIYEKTNALIARNTERGYTKSLQWTAKTLSYCVSILVRAQDIQSAFEVLQKMDSLKNEIFDQPENKALFDFIMHSIQLKKYDYALFCLKYCRQTSNTDVIDKFVEAVKSIEDSRLKALVEPFKAN